MSIEALIQAHTEALQANTEAFKLLTLSLAGRTATAANKAADAVEKPKAEKPAAKVEEKKEEPKCTGVITDPANIKGDNEWSPERHPVPYETVRALVLKLAPTQRDAIKALNARHGLTNAKDMLSNPDDFTSVKDQAKLEAYYADLLALEA